MMEDTASAEAAAARDQIPSHDTNVSGLEGLNDDLLVHALQFSDYTSTCRFTRTSKKNLRISTSTTSTSTTRGTAFRKLWHDVYDRHMFAASSSSSDVIAEIRRRRQLFNNLTGESRLRNSRQMSSKKSMKQCLSLPNRYVHFVPILPQLDVNDEEDREMMEAMEQDPPPVDFGCESYALLPGTSPRFVLMDPFDGTISVYDHVLDGAVRSDDGLLEDAFRAGADAIVRGRPTDSDHMEAETSGDAIDREVEANQNVPRRPPPAEVLHSIEEYFATDLSEYFQLPSHSNDGNPSSAVVMTEHDEVTVDWLGLDLHPILAPADGSLTGNLIGAARILTCESSAESALNVENGSVTRSIMEVLGWKSHKMDDGFDQTFVCRLKGFPNYVDIDANHDKVYATFSPGDGPTLPQHLTTMSISGYNNDDDDILEDDVELDWNGHPVRPSNIIVKYPFVPKVSVSSGQTRRRYFPEPEAFIPTDRPVSCFVIDPTGDTLAVGTDGGCVEIWTTCRTAKKEMKRAQILNVDHSVYAAKERERLANLKLKRLRSVSDAVLPEGNESLAEKDDAMSCEGDTNGRNDVEMEEEGTDDAVGPAADVQSSSLTQCKSTRKINEIFHPRHLDLHRAGFVTLQHHRTEGATLALWQTPSLDQSVAYPKEPAFELSAIINLPLSPQRKPQIHYDGRRLIVVGQDHIGVIVLIYHILSTWEDKEMFESDTYDTFHEVKDGEGESGMPREESGGVINLSPATRRVRYVNRIRNIGLGNLEPHDPIYCACNERYIVINTKCGNLIGGDGGTNACEGLFVIDLEEKE